jgi:hypothetical protein
MSKTIPFNYPEPVAKEAIDGAFRTEQLGPTTPIKLVEESIFPSPYEYQYHIEIVRNDGTVIKDWKTGPHTVKVVYDLDVSELAAHRHNRVRLSYWMTIAQGTFQSRILDLAIW